MRKKYDFTDPWDRHMRKLYAAGWTQESMAAHYKQQPKGWWIVGVLVCITIILISL